jgi:hypothetical protein
MIPEGEEELLFRKRALPLFFTLFVIQLPIPGSHFHF